MQAAQGRKDEELGKMGFSGYLGLLIVIAWVLGDFDS